MSLTQREKTVSFITFTVMLLVVVAPERGFVSTTSPLYGLHWSQIAALLAVPLCFIIIFPELKHRHSLKKYFLYAWPLMVYALIEICFLIYGYGHRFDSGLIKSYPENWWLSYGIMVMLLPGAYFLGFAVRWDSKKQAQFLITAFSLLTIIVLGEYLYGNGVPNLIGNMVHLVNVTTDKIWQWSPGAESLRVTGLYTAPTLLAMITLSGMVWSLSAIGNRFIRVFLFCECALVLVLTASRTEFLAALFLIVCAALVKIQNRGFKNWFLRSLPVVAFILTLIFFVGAGVYFHKFSGNYSAGIITRMNSLDSEEASQEQPRNSEAAFTRLDQLSSGRVTLWGEALSVIEKHPFGTGMPSGCYLTGAHAHNDLLSKYISEGILGIIMIIVMLAWMTGQPDGKLSNDMGLFLAIALFGIGLFDCTFAQSAVLVVPMFLLGLNAGTVE